MQFLVGIKSIIGSTLATTADRIKCAAEETCFNVSYHHGGEIG